ncbi:hypothetical protein L1049_019120 [Liquidambar formosana]|uniref:non-specific serine/threonine protein kinase n=1 Tax=Liquidambar formosana TaxID=63359 RepID=A0AAP0RC24_LIQFO
MKIWLMDLSGIPSIKNRWESFLSFLDSFLLAMSSLLYSNMDCHTGCCNSCIVFQNPEKPMNPINHLSNICQECTMNGDYLEDDGDSVFYVKVSSGTCFVCEDSKQSTPHMPRKNRVSCRKIPVRETTSVNCTKHVNGKKVINQYVRERKISRGSYGKVVLYRNNNNGMPYAVKVFYKSRLRKVRVAPSETAMTNVLREVSIMKMLEHPNIVNLVEIIDDPKSDYLYMVLEYLEGTIGGISETLRQIDETTARRYFKDIIAGVIYLHTHNIVHGDIKPDNLLLARGGRVKIGDFSVSHAFKDDNDELWRCPGTPAFTAPECCLDRVYHGKAADTWAIGVTLYYMVVGCCPFIGDNIPDTYNEILNSPLSIPEELDPELKDLLQGLLCKDPMRRTSLDVVAEHPWVVREGGPIPRESSCSCKQSCLQLEGSMHEINYYCDSEITIS